MSNFKKFILFLVVILVLVIIFVFYRLSDPGVKFAGTIRKISDTSMVVEGALDSGNGGKNEIQSVEIKVTNKTKIIKNTFVKPPMSAQMFDPTKLPKKTSSVDFSALKKDFENVPVGLEVLLKKDLYGKVLMEAKEINYTIPMYQNE